MADDPPLADFEVSRADPDGIARIYACRGHLAHTRRLMQDGAALGVVVTVGPANVEADGQPMAVPKHGCKGHLEDWPLT